ncbi:MAG: Holliday junction resolvase [Desulfurococcaceae archaeon]|nr:Holliday junction resolvase [Desulfurococcaceae archaeon]
MEKKEASRKRSSGISAERELVVKLWKLGFAVIRGPASGAKIKRGVYPDVVAIKNRHVFVFEVKKRSKLDHIYIDKDQIEKLKEFARRAGGEALIAAKITELKIWKAIPIELVKEVSANKVRVDREVIEQAQELIKYLESKVNITLDKYLQQ